MARALWTGSLSFGLINVPVQLFSAVRDLDFHFRQLHKKDGAPIETRRFCSEEDREVPYEAVAHGYELENGKQVVLTDEDLAAVAPRKTRTVDIEAFVDLEDVDPSSSTTRTGSPRPATRTARGARTSCCWRRCAARSAPRSGAS